MIPRTPRDAVIAVLLAFALFSQWQRSQAADLAEANRVRSDSIAAEALVSSMASDSTWAVRFAEHSDDLAQDLTQSGDTARARLAEELTRANVRVGLLAEVLASAQGEIISVGNRAGSLSDSLYAVSETCQGTWEGEIADGLLTGAWALSLPTAAHRLVYNVAIPGELVVAQAGDGRTIVSARSLHPSATLELGSIFVQPPPPEIQVRLSWRQAVLAALIGAAGWEIAR